MKHLRLFLSLIFVSTFSAPTWAGDVYCDSAFEEVIEKLIISEKSLSDIFNDPELLRKLKDKDPYYVALLEKIKELPEGSIELGQLTHSSGNKVETIVPGLYESIPVNQEMKIGNLTAKTKIVEEMIFTTKIFDSRGNEVGLVDRMIDYDNKKIYFSSAFLDGAFKEIPGAPSVPKFVDIPGTLPLVEGRGIPTQTFITLQQMKLAGVNKGELRAAAAVITNNRTLSQIVDSPSVREWILENPGREVPNDVISKVFSETHSYKYLETILTQSGHRIKKVNVAWVGHRPTSVISRRVLEEMGDEKAGLFLIQKKLPDGSLIPMDPDQPLPASIDVQFELEAM